MVLQRVKPGDQRQLLILGLTNAEAVTLRDGCLIVETLRGLSGTWLGCLP